MESEHKPQIMLCASCNSPQFLKAHSFSTI